MLWNLQKDRVYGKTSCKPFHLLQQAGGMFRCNQPDHLWPAIIFPFLSTTGPPCAPIHTFCEDLENSKEKFESCTLLQPTECTDPPDFLRAWAPLLCSESHWCIWVGLHLAQATPSQWLRATGVLRKGGPLIGDRENLWWPMLAGGHLDCLAKAVCDRTTL